MFVFFDIAVVFQYNKSDVLYIVQIHRYLYELRKVVRNLKTQYSKSLIKVIVKYEFINVCMLIIYKRQ